MNISGLEDFARILGLKFDLKINPSIDVREAAAIVLDAKLSKRKTGVILVGGGSPKNFMLQTEPQIQEISLTAKKWEFSPSTLTVNEGDIVTLTVQSLDVTHGMALPAFGVNLILTPGDTKTATFTADKKGTYSFTCSVPCGTGHKDMRGTLVVQ